MVQVASMRMVRAQELLDRGCLLDLGSERCRVLVMTAVVAPVTIMMTATVTTTVPTLAKIK